MTTAKQAITIDKACWGDYHDTQWMLQAQQLLLLWNTVSNHLAFADDIVIVARTQKKLTEVYLDLEKKTSKLGKKWNSYKIKCMESTK